MRGEAAACSAEGRPASSLPSWLRVSGRPVLGRHARVLQLRAARRAARQERLPGPPQGCQAPFVGGDTSLRGHVAWRALQ